MKRSYWMFAIAISTSLLTACGASSDMEPGRSVLPQSEASNKGVLSGTNKGQYMKPGAPVQMSYTSGKVNPGEISNIQATLHLTSTGVEQAQVVINTDKGIVLHSSPGLSFALNLKPGKLDYPLSFSASSVNIGLSYINMVVTTSQGGGNQQTRALAIPIQVGSDSQLRQQKEAGSPVKYDAGGNPVIPMQAEETIN